MKERPLIPAEQQVAHLAERGVRFDRIVTDADARSEKAAGLRTLRRRFLEHADYFEKQIELDRGIRMLGEAMRSGADVISSSSL